MFRVYLRNIINRRSEKTLLSPLDEVGVAVVLARKQFRPDEVDGRSEQESEERDRDEAPEKDSARHRLPILELGAHRSPRLAVHGDQAEAGRHLRCRFGDCEERGTPRPLAHRKPPEVQRHHGQQENRSDRERRSEIQRAVDGSVREDDGTEKTDENTRDRRELDRRFGDLPERFRLLEIPLPARESPSLYRRLVCCQHRRKENVFGTSDDQNTDCSTARKVTEKQVVRRVRDLARCCSQLRRIQRTQCPILLQRMSVMNGSGRSLSSALYE